MGDHPYGSTASPRIPGSRDTVGSLSLFLMETSSLHKKNVTATAFVCAKTYEHHREFSRTERPSRNFSVRTRSLVCVCPASLLLAAYLQSPATAGQSLSPKLRDSLFFHSLCTSCCLHPQQNLESQTMFTLASLKPVTTDTCSQVTLCRRGLRLAKQEICRHLWPPAILCPRATACLLILSSIPWGEEQNHSHTCTRARTRARTTEAHKQGEKGSSSPSSSVILGEVSSGPMSSCSGTLREC